MRIISVFVSMKKKAAFRQLPEVVLHHMSYKGSILNSLAFDW